MRECGRNELFEFFEQLVCLYGFFNEDPRYCAFAYFGLWKRGHANRWASGDGVGLRMRIGAAAGDEVDAAKDEGDGQGARRGAWRRRRAVR